jgi:hypothetical protein
MGSSCDASIGIIADAYSHAMQSRQDEAAERIDAEIRVVPAEWSCVGHVASATLPTRNPSATCRRGPTAATSVVAAGRRL